MNSHQGGYIQVYPSDRDPWLLNVYHLPPDMVYDHRYSMVQPGDTYYDILNVPHDATPQDISTSYRKLAKILHPDVCESSDAEELFKEVNAAYHVLRDPKRRAEYDTSLSLEPISQYQGYYQGTQRYRHPRTWYSPDYHHKPGRKESHTEEVREKPHVKGIPRLVQVLLFYLSLFMAVVIIAELFLIPWIDGANATSARSAFLEGNVWIEEEEYQKAIEGYQKAVTLLPSFSEAWRAKGLAEVRKAEELARLGNSDADTYYHEAIRSFSRVNGQNVDDITVSKARATAFFETGDREKARAILSSIQERSPSDPEISALMQKVSSRTDSRNDAGRVST